MPSCWDASVVWKVCCYWVSALCLHPISLMTSGPCSLWQYPLTAAMQIRKAAINGKMLLGSHQLPEGILLWKSFVWEMPAHCNGNCS